MAKKMISCRVCGKMFKPCSYCQEHSDTFRWRNFACSLECAKIYIDKTITYRESQNNKEQMTTKNGKEIVERHTTSTKRRTKKAIVKKENIAPETIVNEIENNETE